MSKLGSGTFEFTGDDRDFQKVADRVEKTFNLMGKDVQISNPEWIKKLEQAGVNAAGAEPPIKRVTNAIRGLSEASDFGTSSLTRLSQALEGRRIASQAAEIFLRIGHAAEEMATKIRKGEATLGDLGEKIAEEIPIIGRFIEAGRDIHEAITGDKAYTEVVLANAKAQDERTAAVLRFVDALKQITRDTEDVTKRLTTKPGVTSDITGIITGGERAAEDISGKIKERFKKQFDDITEQRKLLSQKLQNLGPNEEVTVAVEGGKDQVIPADPVIAGQQRQFERQIKALDDQAAELRGKIDQFEKATREAIGRGVVTDILKRFGLEFVKATDTAKSAIDSYLARVPQLQDATRTAVNAMITDWQKFQNKMDAFRVDFAKGLIDPKAFQAAQTGALLDAALKPIGDLIKNRLALLGSGVLQTFNFAPLFKAGEQLKTLFSDFGDRRKAPTEFRARTVSLEGLGAGIQEAAASRTGSVEDKQLASLQNLEKLGKATVAAITAGVAAANKLRARAAG